METKLLAFLLLGLVVAGFGSNKTLYKIVLQQNGFAQFIQYDVPSPPLREFTLCMWLKLYYQRGPQSIITYLAKGNNRIMKIWLDDEARYLMLNIKGYTMPKILISPGADTWNHFCFTYQSEYGAYAVYLNGDLLQCKDTEKLVGYAFPAGGSIIIGYGITLDGKPTGLSGEIYGVNMITSSTIISNSTQNVAENHRNVKSLTSNRSINIKYVILDELGDNDTQPNVQPKEFTERPKFYNHRYSDESFDSQESQLNTDSRSIKVNKAETSKHKNDFKPAKFNFKSGLNKDFSKKVYFGSTDISTSSNTDVPVSLVEYEVPPPPPPQIPRTTKKPTGFRKQESHVPKKPTPYPEHTFTANVKISNLNQHKIFHFPVTNTEIKSDSLSQHVIPPPKPPHKNSEKKTHITKLTEKKSMKKKSTKQDSAHIIELSEFELPPPLTDDTKVYGQWTAFTHNGKISDFLKHMRFDFKRVPPTIPLITVSDTFPYPPYKMATNLVPNNIHRRVFYKRAIQNPEVNVKILEENIRSSILDAHSKTQVKNVDITHRGEPLKIKEERPYRDTSSIDNYEEDSFINERPLFVELPFIKALEYYHEDLQHIPRKKNSAHKDNHLVQTKNKPTVIPEHKYAKDHENIIDNNGVYVSQQKSKFVIKEQQSDTPVSQIDVSSKTNQKGFDRHVKLGNALNERFVIGKTAEQKKRSFEGGDDLVPEVNRYRSDIDRVYDGVPSSLMPKFCRSIDMLDKSGNHVEKQRYSTAFEFILRTLRYSSLQDSRFEIDPTLYINWYQTPVRLFGGASPQKEVTICISIKCDTPSLAPNQ